ncbi:MAG: hypothetical protein IPQ01_03885 [Zoogloea sp.]|nr:hypothetical protein [Zoogloea sp.]
MLIISPTNPTNESLAAESPLTVLAACRQIARKYVIPESEVKYEIANALLAGHLYVRNQAGFPSCPDVFDLSVECITLNDLNAYFESNGYRYRLCRTDFAESNAGDEEVGASPRRLPVSGGSHPRNLVLPDRKWHQPYVYSLGHEAKGKKTLH